MEYLAIFNIAFFASLSHCVGMCGGIVMALSAKIRQNQQNVFWAHGLYNFGRVSSYCLIGAFCGGLGMIFEITPFIKYLTMAVIGGLIIGLAGLMFFAPKFLSYLEAKIQSKQISPWFHCLYQMSGYPSFFFLGILNGLLPCGIVYYFALIALSSGGVLQGISVMAIFGFCTILPMSLMGVFSGILFYKDWLYRFCLVLMAIFGFYTLYKGIKGL